MPIYAQVFNGKVNTVAESPNTMIEIESMDERLLGTHYVDGGFIGYKIVLTTNKNQIAADGEEEATITATVYTWQEIIAVDYTEDIIFEVDGVQLSETPVDGEISIPFTSEEAGKYTIKTVNADQYIMSNGSVEVEAQ